MGPCFVLLLRYTVEPVLSWLHKNGNCGPRSARPLRRGDGATLGLGEREQRGWSRGGELQAKASGVGDGPHQHSWLPEVRRDGEQEVDAGRLRADTGGEWQKASKRADGAVELKFWGPDGCIGQDTWRCTLKILILLNTNCFITWQFF